MIELVGETYTAQFRFELKYAKHKVFLERYDNNKEIFNNILKKYYMKMYRSTYQNKNFIVYDNKFADPNLIPTTQTVHSKVLYAMDTLNEIMETLEC
jgi:hypothetical protein